MVMQGSYVRIIDPFLPHGPEVGRDFCSNGQHMLCVHAKIVKKQEFGRFF